MKSKEVSLAKILAYAGLFIVIFLPPVSAIAFRTAFKERVYPKVNAGSIDLGGLTFGQAKEAIDKETKKYLEEAKFRLDFEGESWELPATEIGLSYEAEKTAQSAYSLGRDQGNSFKNCRKIISLLRQGETLDLDFSWNEEKLDQFISTLSSQINQKEVPSALIYKDGAVSVQPGKQGVLLNQEAFINALKARLASLSHDSQITIPVITVGELPTSSQIESAKNRATKLIGSTLIIANHKTNFVIAPPELINFLSFDNGYHSEEINRWIDLIKTSVDAPPKNALFKFDGGKVTQFSPAEPGYSLDESGTISVIKNGLADLEASPSSKVIVEVPVKVISPEVSIENSNQFGISGLLEKGESYFSHSIPARIANLKLAASKLNGILIKPGETFSFNRALGEVSKNTGYQPAWVISQGKTVLGDGGGVCQVSTTLFRAVLNSGLPIVERHAHSYRVGYYEQNSPVGLDATVFDPSADLKFTNDFSCWLLLQNKVDEKENHLVFEIYGCPDGRQAEVTNFRLWDNTPAPPDLYVDDPTLPQGVVKQVDFKAAGAKASFDWKVTRGGQVLDQKTFYSNYRPWQAVYLRGTGTP